MKTIKKVKDNTNNNSLFYTIGVITPYFRLFEEWKKDIGYKTYGKDATFIKISRMEDVVGRSYYTVEKGYKYYEVNSDVYDYAMLHIR